MGYGRWDDNAYEAARAYRRRAGVADFGYDAAMRTTPRDSWRADPRMDPYRVTARESRDSADHPNSTPIVVLFDVTGSMGTVPVIVQQRLSRLHGLLTERGWCTDPQLLFGGIGDADTDQVPLQIGQFESDNRMDEQLRLIFLEGGGGGQKSESYELAGYFIAQHTVTDAWQKRGKKGYLFIIGDELNKERLRARHVRRVIGDRIDTDLRNDSIYAELAKRWETFFILPRQTSYYEDREVNGHWRDLLGERFLKLEDPAAVSDLIALTIGMTEGRVDLGQGLADLGDVGTGAEQQAVARALLAAGPAPLAAGSAPLAIGPSGRR